MRARSTVNWLSHPKLKATWLAVAAGSLAGLAVLGACSDVPVSKVAGPKNIPSAPLGAFGILGANHHVIKVCVDLSSPAGTYSFAITPNTVVANQAWPEQATGPNSADGDLTIYGIDQPNGQGPWRTGTDNDQITNPLNITLPGVNCLNALVRYDSCTPTGATDCDTNPLAHVGNRLLGYHNPDYIVNPHNTMNIQATIPAGYTYSVKCITDDINLPFTGWNTGSTADDCNNTTPLVANPVYVSMNIFHGAQVIYTFVSTETPCPAGTFTWEIADAVSETGYPDGQVGDILIRYDQFPAPNDNSYGVNAVGWPGGHTFGNLTGSDKAGIQISLNSTLKLSFNMDYLTATTRSASVPSGYASLGPNGGDGDMLTGTSAGIQVTTSLANNLNKTGYCVAPPAAVNCTVAGTNLLVNSPPTDAAHLTYNLANPAAHGLWDFHDTYYARITPSLNPALAGFPATKAQAETNGWTVTPNLTVLHNSPAKPCPPTPIACSDITVGAKSVNNKEVKVDVNNTHQSTDAFITGVHITWPQGTNGNLLKIKVGGDDIWVGSIGGGSANLTLAQLTSNADKRKIGSDHDEDVKFIFANNAVTTIAGNYTASLDFGDTCNKPILP